jgi:hypothetical protein
MICPSPASWKGRLEAYHEHFKDYFADRRKSLKQHDVICFTRSGYTTRETQIATGYSYDFILDTVRRFAKLCTIKAIKEITSEHSDPIE